MPQLNNEPPKVHQTTEVNSLLDLQAEFLRKKKEAIAIRDAKPSDVSVNRTKNNIFALTKAEKEEKSNAREARTIRIRRNEEALRKEEEEYAKRRKILEEKSAIYDRMAKGETLVYEDGNQAEFLVNFQLKKQEIEEKMTREAAPSTSKDVPNEYEETEPPVIVHYDPNEEKGRVFGPSHISFAAATEEDRLRKMAELKNLTAQTASNRLKHKKAMQSKRTMERKRINRLRARKGLPLLESSSESEVDEENSMMDLSTIPLPSESRDTEKTSSSNQTLYGIREWDRGKVGYTRWISGEREKRDDEFQPPSFYYDQK